MRRLGKLVHASRQGLLLVKPSNPTPPALGSKVMSREGGVVGVVYDVIGSVASPYVVVKPVEGSRPTTELYVEDERGATRRGGSRLGRGRR